MGKLSNKLRDVSGTKGDKGIAHWCPGCKEMHVIWTAHPGGSSWGWDGNVEKPTVTPSVLCFTTFAEDDETPLPAGQRRTLCHYYLTDGVLHFLSDSPHELSGQVVELPDIPEDR